MNTDPVTTLARVLRILSQYTANPLYPTSNLVYDVELDSLSAHSAMLDLENEFQINDLDYNQERMRTVEDVALAVDQKLANITTAATTVAPVRQ